MSSPSPAAAPAYDTLSEATLGGGCFWCLDAVFTDVQGVVSVECGYSNGHAPRPTYEAVCEGRTGHAEVVRIRFDPQVIDFATLLGIFFSIHDPTSLNRQGNDVGTQYRSGIYTHDESQAEEAARVIEDLARQRIFDGSIVTEVMPVANYHAAEAYHQRYYEHNPQQGYCAFVVGPKVGKFRKQFARLLKPGR